MVAPSVVARLYQESGASRWQLSLEAFRARLETSVAHALGGQSAGQKDADRCAASLHVADLALALACAEGAGAAWDHFVLEYRPALYRSADAIDPTGAARDLADELYADLYGLKQREGERQSLLQYFHGRSSLATWLRAVLAQRYVDRLRVAHRSVPLVDDAAVPDGSTQADRMIARPSDAGGERRRFVAAMRSALTAAIAALVPRDRLRLSCYYAQDLTLAAIGRMLGEHEATASRHLARTRREIRVAVETRLRQDHGLDDAAIAECFRSVVDDAGPLDLRELVGGTPERKNRGQDRSR